MRTGKILAKALWRAAASPGAAIGVLLDPNKTLGYFEFERNKLDKVSFFEFVTKKRACEMLAYSAELQDSDFYKTLCDNLGTLRLEKTEGTTTSVVDHSEETDSGQLLYSIVRALKPGTIVETGVANGESSAVILYALDVNTTGELWSVDLPPQPGYVLADKLSYYIPKGREIGWLVPIWLRRRWHLHLGDAKEILPGLAAYIGRIDVFLHDSLHTFEHMLFEYNTVWPYLANGGVLLSDDVSGELFRHFRRIKRVRGKACSLTAFLKM